MKDSAWNTYVELGHFYTISNKLTGPEDDTNYVFVLNRRTFERPADVSDTSARGRLMDTLTETRVIQLKFNLPNPDTTQYSFIRVREVLPDSTELPLFGKRHMLDTIIYGVDSAVNLLLGPGHGALLEVTYVKPDESMIGGFLGWNNQRKLVYFTDRWHSVYLRNDSILYRRSMRATEPMGSILWEPVETVVSIDSFGQKTQNWPPSMTARSFNGDTIVTIVWSTHSHNSGMASIGYRDVVVRDLNLTQGTSSKIEFVDYAGGRDSTLWGDPVVCAMHGGDVIAWGDTAAGVLATCRLLLPTGLAPVFSPTVVVSAQGRWPSLPPMAHIGSKDSNCAIVWNQPVGANSHIDYDRLRQDVGTGGIPVLTVLGGLNINHLRLSPIAADYGRPSIDQSQDRWWRVQDGITWVEDVWGPPRANIWCSSVYTPTNNRPGWDSIEASQHWGRASTPGGKNGWKGDHWPTIASLNNYTTATDTGANVYAIAFAEPTPGIVPLLRQGEVQFGYTTFKTGWPQLYAYAGDFPNSVSSNVKQVNRNAILYMDTYYNTPAVLRTSRQFFAAKTRPRGYIADGRLTATYINDSAETGFTTLMFDPWITNEDEALPLSMIVWEQSTLIDSIAQWEGIMRTTCFHSHDSTTVGLELDGRFIGDSNLAGAATLIVRAELVDSATDNVVALLDSLVVSAASDSQHITIQRDLDLLSGNYYIRLDVDTLAMTLDCLPHGSRFLMSEYAAWIDAMLERRATRIEATARDIRLSAQPNPFSGKTELRFSVVQPCLVDLRVYDLTGREVVTLMRGEEYEEGRYAIELSAADLPAGSYIVELRAGEERITERVMVRK